MSASPAITGGVDTHSAPSRPRILVVDDDETTRFLARAHLERANFAVEELSNAAAIAEAVTRLRPDAIILDVIMPGVDGFAACAAVRHLPETMSPPILMMTSLEDPESIEKAFLSGATEFACKPVNWASEVHRLHFMLRAARVAAELRASREEWVRSFDAITDLVVVLDRDFRILRANRAAFAATGKAEAAVVGRTCCEVLCCREAPHRDCPCLHLTEAQKTAEDVELPGCGGKPYLLSGAPLTGNNGSTAAFVLTAKDVSNRKLLEQQLLRAQKLEAVGTLSAGVAHEFNNILQAIFGNAEFLQGEGPHSPRCQECVTDIRQTAERGRVLVRQLLAATRSNSDGKGVSLQLNTCITEHRLLMARTLPRGIDIVLQLAPDLRPIKGDSHQIEQILMNLSLNATHAMAGRGRLTITTANLDVGSDPGVVHADTAPGPYVRLSVSDTGHGMDAATLAHLFEPFFTTKPHGHGTGLGLSVVYNLVKAHGGQVTCESTPGQGTTFHIVLPTTSEPIAAPVAPPSHTRKPMGHGERLLVVDDEPGLVALLSHLLGKHGYSVQTATDGVAALELYQHQWQQIDLILLDLGMPRMGGAECLKHIRQLNPKAKVIVTTGSVAALTGRQELREQVAAVVEKPSHFDTLLTTVRAVLDGELTDGRTVRSLKAHA